MRVGMIARPLVTSTILAAGLALGAQPAAAQAEEPNYTTISKIRTVLEPEIRREMVEGKIPSLTIALVDRQGTVWSAAYGESNMWARTPATTETVYLIGSTFKAQSTVALLQQLERRQIRLDDPVSPHLAGLEIRGEDPNRPGASATSSHTRPVCLSTSVRTSCGARPRRCRWRRI